MNNLMFATLGAAIMLSASTTHAQWQKEVEPNNTVGDATPILTNPAKVQGNIYSGGDVDYYAITVDGPSRLYAGVMTSFSSSGSVDSVLTLYGTDGTSIIETDDNDGTFGATASNIAGATLPAAGTYYLQVRHFSASATSHLRGYDLYVNVKSGEPDAEVEPNDTPAAPQPLPASGWVSGNTSSATDFDWYSVDLNAGDTLVMLLDLDPERDVIGWDGGLGIGILNGYILTINDVSTLTSTNPTSEAHYMTVKDTGTYFIRVGVGTAAGTTFGTYHLNAFVIPERPCEGTWQTFTNSTGSPLADLGITDSTINVPSTVGRVGRIRVAIDLTHGRMQDMDIELVAPSGQVVALFNDIGNSTLPTPLNLQNMDIVLDDEAAIPCSVYTVQAGMRYQPEFNYRLDWFRGVDPEGTWTLRIRDDLSGEAGTLNSWSLQICEEPLSTCPAPGVKGPSEVVIFSTDFEADDGGFTSTGTQNEWEWGVPAFAPITTAASGTMCWVTDLDNTYNASSNQDLFSPVIDLTNAVAPIYLRWAQKYHIESATFDHLWVDVQNPGGSNARRLYEWLGATMNASVGSPAVTVNQSAGWAVMEADISEYAGQQIEIRFHLDSDGSVHLAGLAIDDVSVVACDVVSPCPADITGPKGSPDGVVNVSDLLAVIGQWGPCPVPPTACPADITGSANAPDGVVDVSDLLAVIGAWGNCP